MLAGSQSPHWICTSRRWTNMRWTLFRRHAQRCVEPYHLAIEIGIVDHVHRERSELFRLAETMRERDRGGKRILRLLRQPPEQRSEEQAGRDGENADTELRQFARDRQRHADNAALGSRIGGLPDLAVIGRLFGFQG